MIAVRIGPDMRMAVVGSPAYFAKPAAERPQDLTAQLHQPAAADPWRLVCLGIKRGARAAGQGEGQIDLQRHAPTLRAALAGFGLAYLPEDNAVPLSRRGG